MFVDLSFRVVGNEIPADHAYSLYGGLSRLQPTLHQADWLAVHPINGIRSKKGTLKLTPSSRLRFRLPIDSIPELISLAGKRLRIENGKHRSVILLGVPEVHPLRPSPILYSRCVTIKISEVEGTEKGPSLEMFLSAFRKQLAERGIAGEVHIDATRDLNGLEQSRRVLHIKDRSVVGYAVTVSGLSDHDSVKLQAIGLGGRRRMGCGIFVPVKRRTPERQEAVNV